MDLSTRYLGLQLNNPIIAGSSGWTGSVKKIEQLAHAGAGAVVLKSIFEEEIAFEHEAVLKEAAAEKVPLEQFDYYDFHLRGKKLEQYIQLIETAKSRVEIPVIASINCVYSHEWTAFARLIQEAGADAIELNMFFMPSDLERSGQEQERIYFAVIEKLLQTVSIPVALKISSYFSNLAQTIRQLSRTGVAGLVLFNRFFSPDIDIETLAIKPSFVFSTPTELALSLRWIAIMAQKVDCDLAASTGVHDGAAVIKLLLAGAAAVQVASSIYRNGPEQIGVMRAALQSWMERHRYERLADFRGKMSQEATGNPAVYERVQFMRYFGSQEDVTL